VTSERVVENSSQDVSPFTTIGARVGIIEVELADVVSETIVDDVGDNPPGNLELKRGEVSSGVATDEDDGDGGGTTTDTGLSEERRIS